MARRWVSSLLSVIIVLVGFGCSNPREKNFLGSGTLEAEEVIVSSLLAGRLDSLWVKEGDSVAEGQVIALLDKEKLEAQVRQSRAVLEEVTVNRRIAQSTVEQAKALYDNLNSTLQRQNHLLQTGSSTQQIVDDLSTQAATAALKWESARDQLLSLAAKEKQIQATLDLLQLQIADASITAPLTGSIIEKYAEAGEVVPPNGPIVKIANLKRLWMKIYLGEKGVGLVALGKKVNIQIDALPRKALEGVVTWISPKAEFTPKNVQTRELRADLVFAVKVEFENADQRAAIGMPADVYLP